MRISTIARYRNDLGHEELYHQERDPFEEHNLAGKKKHEPKLMEMRKSFDRLAAGLVQDRFD